MLKRCLLIKTSYLTQTWCGLGKAVKCRSVLGPLPHLTVSFCFVCKMAVFLMLVRWFTNQRNCRKRARAARLNWSVETQCSVCNFTLKEMKQRDIFLATFKLLGNANLKRPPSSSIFRQTKRGQTDWDSSPPHRQDGQLNVSLCPCPSGSPLKQQQIMKMTTKII